MAALEEEGPAAGIKGESSALSHGLKHGGENAGVSSFWTPLGAESWHSLQHIARL